MRLLITSASFLATRIEAGRDTSSIGHTGFDMRHSLLVYWFTRSTPRTVGPTNSVGKANSRAEAQMVWTWVAVCGDPCGGVRDLDDCFLSSLSAHTAHFWPK